MSSWRLEFRPKFQGSLLPRGMFLETRRNCVLLLHSIKPNLSGLTHLIFLITVVDASKSFFHSSNTSGTCMSAYDRATTTAVTLVQRSESIDFAQQYFERTENLHSTCDKATNSTYIPLLSSITSNTLETGWQHEHQQETRSHEAVGWRANGGRNQNRCF